MYKCQIILALLLASLFIFGCTERVASENNTNITGNHNQTSIKTYTCLDGTPYNSCSSSKPKYCSNGVLINKASLCGCPSGQVASGDACTTPTPSGCQYNNPLCSSDYQCVNNQCVPMTCSDGTIYGACSSNKPKYCSGGTLIDKASTCGCPDLYVQSGESCILQNRTTQLVYRVIDGDTIELQSGERIRLIGINAPESGQKCYAEATSRLSSLVGAKEIRLERDVTDKDQYGRLLRYVFIDGSFVNLLLVREGYANAYIVSPDVKYSTNITQAEELAKQENGCLWQKSINYSDCINISNFHYDAAGNDNYNLNDEYVTLRNNCGFPVNMAAWTIKDAATHIYYFQNFALNPQAYVTLYTGTGTDSSTKLYWGMHDQAVWNNPGDTLYLRDSGGELVLVYSYGS